MSRTIWCFRYIKEPDLFHVELDTLARVREETPNLHLMIPFVRTAWELRYCLDEVDASPLGRQRGLPRWVMAEVPSIVYRLPEYPGMGIDGVSIGSNDLTQLMLGVDYVDIGRPGGSHEDPRGPGAG